MTRNEYNGWTNYETWAVALWLDNEEGSQSFWSERAREVFAEYESGDLDNDKHYAALAIADELKDQHDEAMPETAGVFADLLNAAMSEVDWYEIAMHYLEEPAAERQSEQATEAQAQ